MGTPDLAAAILARLVEDGHEIRGVLTQPDRPRGRGHKLTASPVKAYALSRGIPVLQPPSLRGTGPLEEVRALDPELIVVAAYGKILPRALLDLPPYGAVNVHTSLLPKYRGAAPINWAILRGEQETGVSIMYMAEELDAGDVISQVRTPIGDDEDARSLTARLAVLGAEALSEAVGRIAAGTASRTPQDPAGATLAPLLSRDLSPVDWARPAHGIHCQVRGLVPWPCAAARIGGRAGNGRKRTGERAGVEVDVRDAGLRGPLRKCLEIPQDLRRHPLGIVGHRLHRFRRSAQMHRDVGEAEPAHERQHSRVERPR